jgi:hypothetical protein
VPQDFSPRSLTIYFAISLFSTGVLCPLEVISTRLAVQRNHESAEFNSVAQEEAGDTEDLPEYSPDEDVIGYDFFRLGRTSASDPAHINHQTEERYGSILGSQRLREEDNRRGRLACVVSRMVVDYAVWRLRCIRITSHFLIMSLHTITVLQRGLFQPTDRTFPTTILIEMPEVRRSLSTSPNSRRVFVVS